MTSFSSSTAVTRFVEFRAPARAVRRESMADVLGGGGTVRTVSRMWSTPPVKVISCGL